MLARAMPHSTLQWGIRAWPPPPLSCRREREYPSVPDSSWAGAAAPAMANPVLRNTGPPVLRNHRDPADNWEGGPPQSHRHVCRRLDHAGALALAPQTAIRADCPGRLPGGKRADYLLGPSTPNYDGELRGRRASIAQARGPAKHP